MVLSFMGVVLHYCKLAWICLTCTDVLRAHPDFSFIIANAEITAVTVLLQVYHQVVASTNPSRQGSLVMNINGRFVFCI